MRMREFSATVTGRRGRGDRGACCASAEPGAGENSRSLVRSKSRPAVIRARARIPSGAAAGSAFATGRASASAQTECRRSARAECHRRRYRRPRRRSRAAPPTAPPQHAPRDQTPRRATGAIEQGEPHDRQRVARHRIGCKRPPKKPPSTPAIGMCASASVGTAATQITVVAKTRGEASVQHRSERGPYAGDDNARRAHGDTSRRPAGQEAEADAGEVRSPVAATNRRDAAASAPGGSSAPYACPWKIANAPTITAAYPERQPCRQRHHQPHGSPDSDTDFDTGDGPPEFPIAPPIAITSRTHRQQPDRWRAGNAPTCRRRPSRRHRQARRSMQEPADEAPRHILAEWAKAGDG